MLQTLAVRIQVMLPEGHRALQRLQKARPAYRKRRLQHQAALACADNAFWGTV